MIYVDQRDIENAEPDEDGVIVMRGNEDGKTVWIAEFDGLRAFSETRTGAKRTVIYMVGQTSMEVH